MKNFKVTRCLCGEKVIHACNLPQAETDENSIKNFSEYERDGREIDYVDKIDWCDNEEKCENKEMTEEEKEYVRSIISSDGVDAIFYNYDFRNKVKNLKFHRLRLKYIELVREMDKLIGIE